MKFATRFLLHLGLLVLSTSGAAHGQILQNGSFELGTADVNGVIANVPSWTGGGEYFGYVGSGPYVPTAGARLMVFNGPSSTPSAVISQTFPTVAGQNYRLEYDLGVLGAAGQVQQVQVSLTGNTPRLTATDSATGSGGNAAWQPKIQLFTADSASTTLTLSDVSPTSANVDLLLDQVRVVIVAPNTAPTAVNDSYVTTANVPLVIPGGTGVLSNDTDPQADALTAALQTAPLHGTVTLSQDGGFTYTPAVNYTGPDSFTYRASDGMLNSNIATVNLTVNAGQPQLLINGSFEQGSPDGGGVIDPIPGWGGSGSRFAYVEISPYLTEKGGRLAVFNGGGSPNDGVLTQSFPTTSGQAYLLRFDLGAVANASDLQQLAVTVTGAATLVSATETALGSGIGAAAWAYDRSYSFVADSATTILTFTDVSTSSENRDLLLDDVRITAVPTRTLAVTSSPVAAVPIRVAPPDVAAAGDGVTNFSRTYAEGATVTLNADREVGLSDFVKWQKDGLDLSTDLAVSVTMDANHTLNAVYLVNTAPVAAADSYQAAANGALVVPAATGVLANDTDPQSTALQAVLEVGPAHGTLLLAGDGGFTYTPAGGYVGTDSFTYRASDGELSSAIVTVSLTVTIPNALVNGSFENGTANWTVTGNHEVSTTSASRFSTDGVKLLVLNDTQRTPNAVVTQTFATIPGKPYLLKFDMGHQAFNTLEVRLKVEVVGGSSLVSATNSLFGANQGISVWSAKSYPFVANSSTTTLTFRDQSPSGSFIDLLLDHVRVEAQNAPPTAVADAYSTPEDVALVVIAPAGVLANDSDLESQPLTALVDVLPTRGTLVLAGDGGFTYTPAANYQGPDSFTYRANDGTSNSATAIVSITVSPVNDAPNASPQTVSATEDIPKGITLSGNDVDGNSLTFTVVTQPTNGVLSGTAPNLTYTPAANYSGPDSFTFKANDGNADSTPATISITVAPVNDLPLANAQSVSATEDLAASITLTGSDIEGSSLMFTVATQPTKGVLSGTPPNLTYTPAANYSGPDSFTFKVNDGTADSTPATVSITVAPVNDLPLANSQSVSATEDLAAPITLTGSDIDGNSLIFTVATQPTKGVLSGTPPNLTYTPTANYSGPDSFTFKVNDGTVDSATALVSITVAAVNDLPLANAQSISTTEDLAAPITLTGSDIEGSPLIFTVATQPLNGVLSGTAPNLIYTPAANYSGPDSFTFKINDGTADSAPATVSITVAPVNDLPLANAQSVSATEDLAASFTLTGSDIEGSTLTFTVVTQPTNGVLSGIAPNLTYTPAANYSGPDSFTFKASDGTADSAPANVSITVAPVNDLPLANPQSVSAMEDLAASFTLTGSDIEGSTLTFTIVTQPSNGVLTGTAPNLTYTPAANYSGPDNFTFKANDGTADSAPATVSITVAPVNDLPLAIAQSVSVDEDASVPVVLTGSDLEGSALNFAVTVQPLHGVLTGTSPNLIYTPAANYSGPDSFKFTANDGGGDSAPATVTINVAPLEEFGQWAGGFGIVPSPSSDPDGDSLGNAIEYVVGGNPANVMDVALLPTLSVADNYLNFTYRRTELANTDSSLAIFVEWQAGLDGPWVNSAGTVGVETSEENNGAGAGIDLVTVRLPRSLAADGKLFARLRAVVATP